jgi:peptide/nickel transport system substrate-binding protein
VTPLRTAAIFLVGIACHSVFAEAQAIPTTLRVVLPSYPGHLHYPVSPQPQAQAISSLVAETLVAQNLWTGKTEPRLAETVQELADGKTFLFKLDAAARFSNSQPVTPEDVVFSWDLLTAKDSKATALADVFQGWQRPAVDKDGRLRFQAPRRHYRNLELLAELPILSKKTHATIGYHREILVGSGPYRVEKVEDGTAVSLSRQATYWGESRPWARAFPRAQAIRFTVVGDPRIAWEKLRVGTVDYVYNLSSTLWFNDILPAMKNASPLRAVLLRSKQPGGVALFFWNQSHPVLGERAVRCSLQSLMDRRYWTQTIFQNAYSPARGVFPSNISAHDPSLPEIPFSPAQAQHDLQSAGWVKQEDGFYYKNGRKLSFELLLDNPAQERIATIYQEQLREAGIEMTLRTVDWASAKERLSRRQYEGALVYRQNPELDLLLEQWGAETANRIPSLNRTGYNDLQIDVWANQLSTLTSAEKRNPLYRQIERRLVQECVVGLGWENSITRLILSTTHLDPTRPIPPYSDWTNAFWAMSPSPAPLAEFSRTLRTERL